MSKLRIAITRSSVPWRARLLVILFCLLRFGAMHRRIDRRIHHDPARSLCSCVAPLVCGASFEKLAPLLDEVVERLPGRWSSRGRGNPLAARAAQKMLVAV